MKVSNRTHKALLISESVRRKTGGLRHLTMRALSLAALASLLVPAQRSYAQTGWNDTSGDHQWSTAGNWAGTSTPPAGDDVTNHLNDYITFANGIAAINSFLSDGGAAFNMTGGTLNVANSFTSNGAVSLTGTDTLGVGALGAGGTLEADGNLYLYGASDYNATANGLGVTAEIDYATIQKTTIDVNYSPGGSRTSADLNGVTLDAGTSLNINGGAPVYIDNGLSFTNAALAAGVPITIGYQGSLIFNATNPGATLILGSNVAGGAVNVTMASNSQLGPGSGLEHYNGYGGLTGYNATSFTIGANVNVNVTVTGGYASIGDIGGFANIINNGNITVNTANAGVTISSGVTNVNQPNINIINNGVIAATASNAYVTVSPGYGGTFTNNGIINISGGGNVPLSNVASVGVVNIDSNAQSYLSLDGGAITSGTYATIVTPAELAGIKVQKGGGGLYLQGSSTDLYVAGGSSFDPTSLNADGSSAYSAFHMAEGTISGGGTIQHAEDVLFEPDNTTVGGIIDGMTLSGDPVTGGNLVFNLTDTGGSGDVNCFFEDNVNFGANSILNIGTVPGQGNASLLYTSTDNAPNIAVDPTGVKTTINLGSATTYGVIGYGSYEYSNHYNPIGYSFTIAPAVTIQGAGYIGANPTVSGYGDTVINNGTITANIAGTTLAVSSGGDNGSIAPSNLDNNGTIQSTTNGTKLNVSSGATGVVTNAAGATLSATGGSTATVSGGSFVNNGTLSVDSTSVVNLDSGKSAQAAGTTVVNGALGIVSSTTTNTYTLNGGTLTGSGQINGNLDNEAATVEPGVAGTGGAYGGTLTINGNYTQGANGTLQIDLPAGNSGALTITGNAALNGKLVLNNEGLVPVQKYDEIVKYGNNPGNTQFSNAVNDAPLADSAGNVFVVSYNYAAGGGVFLSSVAVPSTLVGNAYMFTGVASGQWFDPATADGFDYATTDGSLFTSLILPGGFSAPFDVLVSGVSLGEFSGGSMVTFAGDGVSGFEISGIDPAVDSTSDTAFPAYLTFNDPTASFSMTPVLGGSAAAPEPGALSLALAGLGTLGVYVRRKCRVSTSPANA